MSLKYFIPLVLLLVSFNTFAGRVIESVTLNPNPVAVNASLSATITASGNSIGDSSRWRSTGYSVDGGTESCVNHENYDNFTSESTNFSLNNITNSPGTYQIDFVAYRNNSCGNGDSDTFSVELTVANTHDLFLSEDTIYDYDAEQGAIIGDITPFGAYTNSNVSITYNNAISGSCDLGTSDNSKFSINSNVLSISNPGGITLPARDYIICVKTDDNLYSKNFVISVVENPDGVPTKITLNPDTTYDYEAFVGIEIGDLLVTDEKDSTNVVMHTWEGGTNAGSCANPNTNSIFEINNNKVSIKSANGPRLDVGEYTICVKTDDDFYRQNLTIKVIEPAQEPTFFTISNDTISTSHPTTNNAIGEFLPTAEGASYTFSEFVVNYNESVNVGECTGAFNQYNSRFTTVGNELFLKSWVTSLDEGEHEICVKATRDDGITYIRDFTITVTSDIDDIEATFLDKFNNQSYSNNDGELDWAANWLEYNDDSSANSGDIKITSGSSDTKLQLSGPTNYILRRVDLSQFTQATLSLDYEISSNSTNDEVYVVIRTNNNNYAPIIYTFPTGGNYQGSIEELDISDYLSDDTDVGIYTSSEFDSDDDIYINNFAINATGAPEPEDHIFFDRFNSVSYSNNDGELDWSGSWNESNDDGSPSSGKITISNSELTITSSSVSISREADLSSLSTATLSFSYSSVTSYSDDIVYLQIRTANGNWTTLESFIGSDSSNASGDVTYDITSYIGSDVDVRFVTASGFDSNDSFKVNDFAIDGTISAFCPDLSAYKVIFNDDFSEDTHALADTWAPVDFDRSSTNVWPGDTIYQSPNESQTITYAINNDTLKIAGDTVNSGNNEYGVLLHNVDDEGYSSSTIQTYAIETTVITHADQIGNNDIGVVFGYVDEDDFYLLRWTKIGSGYSNDTNFPGDYRNLDLVHVQNGVPTLLSSKPNFYTDDPMNIRITVDENGISVCINDSAVLSYASAQPEMNSVGFYSYDNDYDGGFQVEEFLVFCRDCEIDGIIGWWAMEDSFDDVVGDNHLTEYGNVGFGSSNVAKTVGTNSTCKYGEFDGASYGRVNDSGYLNSDELAVSAWVYPTSYPNDENDTNGADNLMSISSKDVNYEFHINQDGKLYWWWQNESNATRSLTSANSVPLNTWSHVAISYQAGEQKMYINGVLEDSGTWNETPKHSTCDYFVGADVATGTCDVIPERTFIGLLDEVRIYERYLTQNEVIDDSNFLRECGLVNSVDHYRIDHPQNNLSCSATSVTVKACGDEFCSQVIGADVTGNLHYTLGGNTTTLSGLNLTNAPQQVEFNQTTVDTITLGLNSMSPDANIQCFYNSGTQSSCDITYTRFGYKVTASDITSSESVSDANNRISVQALEAIENNPAVCEPSLVGNKQVSIDFSYLNPPTNYDQEALNVSLNDSSYTSVTSGSGTTQTLNFNATDATAYFYVRYADAGALQVSVADVNLNLSTNIATGYDNFNVIPASINLQVKDENDNILGSSGNLTHYAGQNFNLSIQALNADGNITNNYRPGDLEIQSVMNSPLISSGANPVQFYYGGTSPASVTNDNSVASWTDATSLTFDNNGFSNAATQFDNVGSFTLDVKDSNYLGYQINSDSVTSAGRFIPAYFTFATPLPDTEITDTHTTFSYFGELLDFPTNPVFSYVAKTYTNQTATNYVFVPSNFGFVSSNYSENTSYTPAPYPSSAIENIDLSVQGQMNFSLSDPFIYEKPAVPREPLTSTISLLFSANELLDADNIGYDVDGISNDLPSYEGITVLENTFNLRYGRLFLENAYGNETSDLKVEMILQYFSGGKFVTNTDDSETTFSGFNISITEDGNPTIYTSNLVGSSFVAGKTPATDGLFINAPNVVTELDVKITNLPDWLNVDWDNDADIDDDDNVSSTVIFGSYRGNDRIIYKRER
ncbi:MAG: hypothetical protein ACJAZB_000325 [Psychrosphaera sp.]